MRTASGASEAGTGVRAAPPAALASSVSNNRLMVEV
jgi:hypothetical protein